MEMLNELAVFAQVVEHGGFSAASRNLQLTTSAVSRHISRLEKHLGGRLLQRTTRSIALTELGVEVHAACLRMLSEAREIHALAGTYSARPNGVIRISAPVVFGEVCLAPLLPEFLAQHPDVDVRLTLIDRSVDLVEEGVDLAIRIARELAPGLAARPLCEMRYILVATPAYLKKAGKPKRPQELEQHRCIYLGYARFGQSWTMKRRQEQIAVQVPTRLTINNSAAIMSAVLANGGIGLVPDFTAAPALASGQAVQILSEWQLIEPYAGSVHAVYVPGRHIALKTRAFIDFLVDRLAPRSFDSPTRN